MKKYKKIEIENLWNQLVYNTYKDKIVINEEKLKKILANKKQRQIKISEILFQSENENDLRLKYDAIIKSVDEIGFEKQFYYSVLDQNSGNIGWVNENSLSDEILKKISNLNVGKISEPIIIHLEY